MNSRRQQILIDFINAGFITIKDLIKLDLDNIIKSDYCCGGSGAIVLKDNKWQCAECGADAKTDSSLNKYNPPDYLSYAPSATVKKCECGSTKVGSDKHSYYCPKYK